MTPDDFFSLADVRRGHFQYESGFHSNLWLDLETLCHHPEILRPFVVELCSRIADFTPDVICGPLIEGAFVALLAASELRREFVYTLRLGDTSDRRMFPVTYELPQSLRSVVTGKRVIIVNDVISAGSAVLGALQSLRMAGAQVVAIASLVVLGESFLAVAQQENIPLTTLLNLPNDMWEPENCPLCTDKVPLQRLADY